MTIEAEKRYEMKTLSKQEWILLLLRQRPLDRIRLMKALFLIWYRSGKQIDDFFIFTPYMYGPCSFELYSELSTLQKKRLVSQAPHPVPQWALYYLTPSGAKTAALIENKADAEIVVLVRSVAEEVSSMGFHDLLQKIYSEAPEYASRTVLPWRPKQ